MQIATAEHVSFAQELSQLYEDSAKKRGTGIAKRDPEYIIEKILQNKAIIATTHSNQLAGFCYIESWGHDKFVANSGLIVAPEFRKAGLATEIKHKSFELSRKKYPQAKLFGLTTSIPVMKINQELGYRPVSFSELTDDEEFWKGCSSCVNYDILTRTNKKHCLCTGMIYDPAEKHPEENKWELKSNLEKFLEVLTLKKGFLAKLIGREV